MIKASNALLKNCFNNICCVSSLALSTKSLNQVISNSFSGAKKKPKKKKKTPQSDLPDIAKIIDGNKIAKEIRGKMLEDYLHLKKSYPHWTPGLAVIQIGKRSDSNSYVGQKEKACKELGFKYVHKQFPEDVTEVEILRCIEELNEDQKIHGIIVQLPVPEHLNTSNFFERISASKDVDAQNPFNVGKLSTVDGEPLFEPCTPKGIMRLLQEIDCHPIGKNAVVVGMSNIVGRPMSNLLLRQHATVTVCHKLTQNTQEIAKTADILITATGVRQLIKADWVKPGAVVVDVGIIPVPDPKAAKGIRLRGDVSSSEVSKVAGWLTPVPGGVGPMTVAMLMENVFTSAKRSILSQDKQVQFCPLPLHPLDPVPDDLVISQSQTPKKISLLASEIGLYPHEIEIYGKYKAKVDLNSLDRLKDRPNGKYIVITGITPTPLGEGKSTTTYGLAQALGAHLKKTTFANVRQPSQGPTFGIKGGAAGGGYAKCIPMEDFNLHLTGDIHAITAANNLLCAALDARMYHEKTAKNGVQLFNRLCPVKKGKSTPFSSVMFRRLKKLGINKKNPKDLTDEEKTKFAMLDIDPSTITIKRVVDTNDRFLRGVEVGIAKTEEGYSRKTGFDIAVASEVMAILALATSLPDLRERIGRMVIAFNKKGFPVTADDIGCSGAMTVLLQDAIKPNLMQTLEGTPVFVHAGPFANIAHGNSSIIADQIALKLAGPDGYVLTEAGFGSDMGVEKFFNIKCRASNLIPNCSVLICSPRALKMHGGGPKVTPGSPLAPEYRKENLKLIQKGLENLRAHIKNCKQFGVPVVVAITHVDTATPREIDLIKIYAKGSGAFDAVESNHWALGGKGAVNLANAVVKACNAPSHFQFLYDVNWSIEKKIETIAKKVYGADGIDISPEAQKKIKYYNKNGFDKLPICMAKTHLSLSHDPKLKNAPKGFRIPVRDIRASIGAGFLYPLLGQMQTMPGLSSRPSYFDIDIDLKTGKVVGLA